MKSPRIIATGLMAGLLFTTATFIPAHAQSKPTIVFVPNGPADFWKAAGAGVKAAQKDLPGFDLKLEYPDQATAASQKQLLDNLVSAGVKGIMISTIDPATATKELNKVASETALFTTDSDAPNTKRVAYIGSSNIQAGKQAAEIAKEAMPHGGKCMGFVGLLGSDSARERIEGFREGVQGSGITLVDVRGDDMDVARAKSNVADTLVADPSITCLVGFFSYNTPEIYEALKESGELGKITVVGFDGDPVTLGGIEQGYIAGTVVQQPYQWAYQGMKMIAAYIKGDKSAVPSSGIDIIPTKIITKATVANYEAAQKALLQ